MYIVFDIYQRVRIHLKIQKGVLTIFSPIRFKFKYTKFMVFNTWVKFGYLPSYTLGWGKKVFIFN